MVKNIYSLIEAGEHFEPTLAGGVIGASEVAHAPERVGVVGAELRLARVVAPDGRRPSIPAPCRGS